MKVDGGVDIPGGRANEPDPLLQGGHARELLGDVPTLEGSGPADPLQQCSFFSVHEGRPDVTSPDGKAWYEMKDSSVGQQSLGNKQLCQCRW